jgi:hypothetical protein
MEDLRVVDSPSCASDLSSDGGSEDAFGDAGWQDLELDEESMVVVSLFDEATFPDLRSMLDYCREKHGFDFMSIRAKLGLDFHGAVKLCNFGECIHDASNRLADPIVDGDYPSPRPCSRRRARASCHHAGRHQR